MFTSRERLQRTRSALSQCRQETEVFTHWLLGALVARPCGPGLLAPPLSTLPGNHKNTENQGPGVCVGGARGHSHCLSQRQEPGGAEGTWWLSHSVNHTALV